MTYVIRRYAQKLIAVWIIIAEKKRSYGYMHKNGQVFRVVDFVDWKEKVKTACGQGANKIQYPKPVYIYRILSRFNDFHFDKTLRFLVAYVRLYLSVALK